MANSLIRDVVERHGTPSPSSPPQAFDRNPGGSSSTGFPAVQHRSKTTSAFKRARLDQRIQTGMSVSKEGISSKFSSWDDTESPKDSEKKTKTMEDSMGDISQVNAEAVERMTEEQIQREREDIFDRFGPGINDLMTKVREARERRAAHQASAVLNDTPPHTIQPAATSVTNGPSNATRPRSARKIRFVDPTEADVYVYESQPSSPKRTLALLPPPPEDPLERTGISPLGTFKGSSLHKPSERHALTSTDHAGGATELPEAGTPEDIRRRFFPSEVPPEENPALAWMLSSSTTLKISPLSDPDATEAKQSDDAVPIEARYSLSGVCLSPSQISDLPSHLGLHHHASSSSDTSSDTPAGYTLPDLLLLARSSVPAQRASILGVLAKILEVSREEAYEPTPSASENTANALGHVTDLDAIRRDVTDAAIDALGEKGGVGQRAVDVLWEAVVACTQAEFGIENLDDFPLVDLTPGSPPTSSSTRAPSDSASEHKGRIPPTYSQRSAAILVSLPLTRILSALKIHLTASPSPLSLTHSRVLDILFVLSHFSQHARTMVHPDAGAGVITAMLGPHLQSSFDTETDEEICATPASVRVLQALARSGRDVAMTLTGPADVLLRYIMTPLPALDLATRQFDGYLSPVALLEETLIFYTLLAQYGIYAHVATSAQNHFAHIGTWLLANLRPIANPNVVSLTRAYLGLLEGLIVCATDPHKTTPSHDILWSQVRGWGWIDWTLDFADVVAAASESLFLSSSPGLRVWQGVWTSICRTLAACVESASVNGIRSGEEERMLVLERVGPFFENGRVVEQSIRDALANLQFWSFPLSASIRSVESLRTLAEAAGLVAAATRLALACFVPGEGYSFALPAQEIHEACIRFLKDNATPGLFDLVSGKHTTTGIPENAHTFVMPLCALLVNELQLWQRSMTLTISHDTAELTFLTEDWMAHALRILHTLLPGDENRAKWIFEVLCNNINSSFVQKLLPSTNLPDEQWDKDGMNILIPFLMHSLLPKAATGESEDLPRPPACIAPISPTPESIAQCTTLAPPSLSCLRDAWLSYDQSLVLPLRSDWPTWPLNHLLRSGSSPVFRELPASWDASETDVVRAVLLLVCIVRRLDGGRNTGVTNMSRAETIFACMKVFMLEHGQQQLDSGEEVFRDLLVTRWMDELVAPFAYASTHGATERGLSLEQVAKAFLGTETPFYQFYTDFLALYDAISFSHPLFGRLLLPPVSMTYAIDYRKLLFGDYGHTIRTIQTDVDEILCVDVRDYLWPIETDAHMIGWYLKALVTSPVRGFVRWIAMHHVASNIWPEFRDDDTDNLERASKLLSAVVGQGSISIIRDIAVYRQLKEEVWTPPRCYDQNKGVWTKRRLDFVERIGDQRVKKQLHNLFI